MITFTQLKHCVQVDRNIEQTDAELDPSTIKDTFNLLNKCRTADELHKCLVDLGFDRDKAWEYMLKSVLLP
jgi:hypothetical protein